MTIPEVVDTLQGAIERAGPPWSFVPAAALERLDLDPADHQSWPIWLPAGQLLGMVVREHGGSDRYDELIRVLLRTVQALAHAQEATAAAEQRAVEAERRARVDPLTGLLNRRAWSEALAAEAARMQRSGRPAAVVVVDIDGLKEANDTDGHLAGDLLIRRTAEALRRTVRDGDVVARLGGDEFAVLAVDSDPTTPERLLGRVRHAFREADVSASVGVAAAGPTEPLQRAFEEADRAMYRDKRRRRSQREDGPEVGAC